ERISVCHELVHIIASNPSAQARLRVFKSAGGRGADRTSDRAGAEQEEAARFQPARQCTVSRVVFVKWRWRGRVPPSAPLPGGGSRSTRDHSTRLSRSGPQPWPVPTEPTRRLCHRGPYWSGRDLP